MLPHAPQIDYTVLFAILSGIWAILLLILKSIDNNQKKKNEKRKIIKEYNDGLKAWANEVIEIMTTAGFFCDLDPQQDSNFYQKRHVLLIKLSTEIDKGRLFLPNTGLDQHGEYKESAYRGFRSEALNAITRCFKLVNSLDFKTIKDNKSKNALIMNQKRIFVSEIQDQIDPQKFELNFIGKLESYF